jgi:hypothetical protein
VYVCVVYSHTQPEFAIFYSPCLDTGLAVVRCAVQVCLRYLAISQVLAEMEQQQIPGAALGAFPPEELDALRRDFYTQVLQL